MAKAETSFGKRSATPWTTEQWEALAVLFAALVGIAWMGWMLLAAVYRGMGATGAAGLALAAGATGLALSWKAQAPARADAARLLRARQARASGEVAHAEQMLTQLLRDKAEGGRAAGRAAVHWELLGLYRQLKRWDDAVGQARAAMAASEVVAGPEERQIAQQGPAVLMDLLTRLERWKDLAEFTQERLAKATGRAAVELRLDAAASLQRQGKKDESLQQLRDAAAEAQRLTEDKEDLYARALHALGAAALEAESLKEASEVFGALRGHAGELPAPDGARAKWDLLGAVGLAQSWVLEGNAGAAAALLNDAVETSGQAVSGEIRAKSLYLLAGALLTAGHFHPARRRTKEALALWDAAGDPQAETARALLDSIALQEALAGASEVTESGIGG